MYATIHPFDWLLQKLLARLFPAGEIKGWPKKS
jgi:hypothetical protein